MTQPLETEVLVVGAGPAGLAAGACLRRADIPLCILEKGAEVGSVWRRHYDRLHLHTDVARSNLPHFSFPKASSKYPSRLEVIEYLESYARRFELNPIFGQTVVSARRENGGWLTHTEDRSYVSRFLVVATGYTGEPVIPEWPGQTNYGGCVLHSSEYRNGESFEGESVLVVGFGNSGGEIAIDLHEHGAHPHLAVRGRVNVVPRDVFGLPILAIAIPVSRLPARLGDALTAPIVRWKCGDIEKLGLKKEEYGPLTQILRKNRIPLLDVGTLDLIRRGQIEVHPEIERFSDRGVVFDDGSALECEAVVLATGYRPAVSAFLGDSPALDQNGVPKTTGCESEIPGLFFCGFWVAPTGMFREIAIEARKIARLISNTRG